MSTARATITVISAGVLLALLVAAIFRAQSPQGLLLYTPGPYTPASYTSASATGFFLTMLALTAVSFLAAAIAAVGARSGKPRWATTAKAAMYSGIAFAIAMALVSLTERQWP